MTGENSVADQRRGQNRKRDATVPKSIRKENVFNPTGLAMEGRIVQKDKTRNIAVIKSAYFPLRLTDAFKDTRC